MVPNHKRENTVTQKSERQCIFIITFTLPVLKNVFHTMNISQIIKKVKNALHIPVIGNGDIVDVESAITMFGDTGCDGIMIGRAAVGNPFIFSEIICALEGKEYIQPSLSDRIDVALEQLSLAIKDKGEAIAIPESRKQIASYFKSFRGSAALRCAINSAKTESEVRNSIIGLLRGCFI